MSSRERFWLFRLAFLFVFMIVIGISTAIVKHVKQHNLQKSIFIKKINELSLKNSQLHAQYQNVRDEYEWFLMFLKLSESKLPKFSYKLGTHKIHKIG